MLTNKPPADSSPIRTDEVQAWLGEVIKKGSVPDERTCAVIASMLCNCQPGGWRHGRLIDQRWPHVPQSPQNEAERDAWDKAAGSLRSRMSARRKQAESGPVSLKMLATMEQLEAALHDASEWFGWGPKPAPGTLWHDVAKPILVVVQQALSYGQSSSVGIASPGAQAVKFTKIALNRLGFPEPTEAAIADLFSDRKKKRLAREGRFLNSRKCDLSRSAFPSALSKRTSLMFRTPTNAGA